MNHREQLILALLLALSPCLLQADGVDLTFPDPKEFCKDVPWCSFKATKQEWPVRSKAIVTKSVEMKEGPFTVDVPADFTRISAWGDLLAVFYKDYTLYIGLSSLESRTTAELKPIYAGSSYKFIDIPRLVFTATLADDEPSHPNDRFFWRGALREKASLLTEAKEGGIYENKKVVAYSARINRHDITSDTVLIHKDRPDAYLRIYGKGIGATPDIILGVIASFKMSIPNTSGEH